VRVRLPPPVPRDFSAGPAIGRSAEARGLHDILARSVRATVLPGPLARLYREVMRSLFLFAVLTWMTGNPILSLLIVVALSLAGLGFLSGHLFRFPRVVERWLTIRELARTLRTNPHDATAQADIGRLLVEAGQPARALPHLEAAHSRAPEVPETSYYLGAALLSLGDGSRGRPLVEEALDRDPRLGYGLPHLRLADYYLDRRQPGEALPHLERFAEMHASSVEGQYKLARALRATGQPDRARAALDEAVRAYSGAPRFKRREERLWRLRAEWLRWVGRP
jgi:tetratricopeptide (TPR) repeat protein